MPDRLDQGTAGMDSELVVTGSPEIVAGLCVLDGRDEERRDRAVRAAAALARAGRIDVTLAALDHLARTDEAVPWSGAALSDIGDLMGRLLPGERPPAQPGGSMVVALFHGAAARPVRRLAARVLDASGQRPSLEVVRERLGEDAARFLIPYLEHSGATHQDLVELTASGGPPPFLEGLRQAEQTLGGALLREIVARLGWSRLTYGFSAETRVGLSAGRSFPFVLAPEHAQLLGAVAETQTAWRRHLVVAHGGPADASPAATSDEAVRRFRDYNLTHAELLDEILAVAPLDRAKIDRILGLMDRVVADFSALFAGTSEDARQVTAVYERLRGMVRADLGRDGPSGALSGETVRRMQMFEDPRRLEDVTTVHGLKRFLHQLGLRLAFRLFRAEAGANRTVDLIVAGERDVLQCVQVIRYLEFESTPPVGPARLPFVVALIVESLGRQLLLGRTLPWVTILGYGNELQIYVSYRNHPAFLRIDLSPPLRGGMIDLEYYAVSQYELDQHPDLSLQAIQRVLQELDFDVAKDGLRLHARYDKERALDFGDLVEKARAVFDLLPYLMEVDWIIGDLDYPAPTRAEIAAGWAGFFARWGVLPSAEVLSASRRKILVAIEPDPAGPHEVVWDGRGAYRDRFGGTPPEELGEGLRGELERRGLGAPVSGAPASQEAWGQRLLERAVVRPLREAAARGEVRCTRGGIEPVAPDRFAREHEAERLAAIVAQGGPALQRAARIASLVRGIERQARFHSTGSVQGYAVQAATLSTAPRPVGLFVLRDDQGIARLALAAEGAVLYRGRRDPGEPWSRHDELEPADLARALRAYNYMGAGSEPSTPAGEEELEKLRRRFSAPSAVPLPRQRPGERFVPATIAAPGHATGFASFQSAGRSPEELDGAVLLARTLRPEDAPWLRHAAGIVCTGGGVLSHVGLIALELQKPALILDGRWVSAPSGAEVLLYRRPQWREVDSVIAGLQVVCRHDLREAEEVLEQGDLVTLDGESGGLVVLGHDPQVLALHQDLRQLEEASTALATARADREILACRGRLIRAVHQLQKLLARLDRPVLARHLVRELLTLPSARSAPEGRQGRTQLLAVLLRNPTCKVEARRAAEMRLHDLRARLEGACRSALEEVPRLANPAEVLFTLAGVRHTQETLADALDLVDAPGLEASNDRRVGSAADTERVEAACRERLEELQGSIAARADACRKAPTERWRLRHLLPRLAQLAEVLGTARGGASTPELVLALRRADDARAGELGARRTLGMAEGGVELEPLVGSKAAHLREIARVLGEAAVPPWFAVADSAFREMLATPVSAATQAALGIRATDLQAAIAEITSDPASDPRRQAAAVRELWAAMPLPAGLVADVAAAYRALARVPGEDALVAIRSSGREEDSEAASWAGQFDTFLFVQGLDAVLDHLKLAWAGFWTERAIDRRRLSGASPVPRGGGVIVQRMVDSRVSGVLHTVCAASGRLREMLVNAGLGLGEGIVSGAVDVDHVLVSKDGDLEGGELELRYRVGDKREQVVRDRERGSGTRRQETLYHQRLRPALEYVELCELVRAAARLEDAFLEPLDIEFAIEGRDLHILQARPVPIFDVAWRECLTRRSLPGHGAGAKEVA